MSSRVDISNHVTKSQKGWACVPLPPEVTSVPNDPFTGMSVTTLVNAPPQLLAHILRTKANKGVQVVSPRQTPMLATVERIDPGTRQADHIVVTTQASSNTGWPTCDGRKLDGLFPNEPNRCTGADASQVVKTKTRVIGKALAANAASDPVSRAVVRSASVIDIQRRQDVGGDADVLAEVLDVSWGLPLGTFGTLAPLVLASSEDLLRTAISSDHNAPDALMSIQRKKVIHVHGGTVSRDVYGSNVGMDWSRQRAIARTIFHLSTALEGMDLLPNFKVWAAADMRAPMHSSEREKHLVFQPVYGSGLRVDPMGFCFIKPAKVPKRYAKCHGLNPPTMAITLEELNGVLAAMVEAGLPLVAAATVRDTFRLNSVRKVVMGSDDRPATRIRGADAAAVHIPRGAALAVAYAEVTSTLRVRLARGAAPSNVIRSRIYHVMESIDAIELIPIFRTMAVLKREAAYYDIPAIPYDLLKQLASRMSHVLGALVVRSVAVESERMGATLDEWYSLANEVVPRYMRSEDCTTLGWATVAVWNLWSGTTGKWANALRSASHSEMARLGAASIRSQYVTMTVESDDMVLEAARRALAACQRLYAPYYERMYDYYALLSKNSRLLVPVGVGNAVMPAYYSAERKRSSIIAYTGACLWQLRGRHLRSAYVKKIPLGAPHELGMERRINCVDYEIAIMCSPNKAYETFRVSVESLLGPKERSPLLKGARGDIRHIVASLPEPIFDDAAEACDENFPFTRLARYVMSPGRWAEDIRKTYDEVVVEVARAAMAAKIQELSTVTTASSAPLVTSDTAALAPASVYAARSATIAVLRPTAGGAPAQVTISAALAERPAPVAIGKTGWLWAKEVYGAGAAEVIADVEDMATEDDLSALFNTAYATREEFEAAMDAFYGEDEAAEAVAAAGAPALTF